MDFTKSDSWGFVELGTRVQDSKGTKYIVEKTNDAGFLNLKNISGGENIAFEVLDPIDHAEFHETE